ncbi:hypothetical protein N9K67_03760, partial [Opitutaceae bacterium]|nr:hypothetical protein [Opitutaceae bacterium]
MRIVRLSILLTALPALLAADDFSGRYDEIRSQATPEQLYKFLYALPKGGDLHNHFGGSIIPEWKWDILTDPSRNGGDIYYARVRFDAAPDAIDPRVLNHTIRHHTYENLPGAKKSEYVPLKQLTATERESWLNAFRLDAPGEGRHEFFAYTWDRLGDIHRNPHVRFELLAEHIKAFAGEGLRYLETMFGLYTMTDNEGRVLSDEEMLALMEARLAQPDVASTGVELRFLDLPRTPCGISNSPTPGSMLTGTAGWASTWRASRKTVKATLCVFSTPIVSCGPNTPPSRFPFTPGKWTVLTKTSAR